MNKKFLAIMLGATMTISSGNALMASADSIQKTAQKTTEADSGIAKEKESETTNAEADEKKENNEIWGQVTKVDEKSIEITVGSLEKEAEKSEGGAQAAGKESVKSDTANKAETDSDIDEKKNAGKRLIKLSDKSEEIAVDSNVKLQREKKTEKKSEKKSELEAIKLTDIKVGDIVKITCNADKKPTEIVVVNSEEMEVEKTEVVTSAETEEGDTEKAGTAAETQKDNGKTGSKKADN